MGTRYPGPGSSNELRKRAGAHLEKRRPGMKKPPPVDVRDLIEDLRMHQVELKMQNEELRRAYEELEKAKEIYSDLYDFAPVGYLTLDENNLIFRVNLFGAQLLGRERRSILGRRFSQFISADWENRFYTHRRRCIETREKQGCELMLRGEDKNPRYILLESVAFPDDQGIFNRIRAAMIEITDQKRADERIRSLSRELLKSHENERQMISRELHDRIAQHLSAAKLGYEHLISSHLEIPEEVRQEASALAKVLQDAIMAVRDLSYDLRPPEFEKKDIVKTLFHYCGEFSRKTGIDVDFFSAGMEDIELNELTLINLYRVVQEGLVNIQKHAEASRVNITISYSTPDILLRIMDNGKGFDIEDRQAALTSERRMGLRSMQERARLLGGAMRFDSRPGQGTKIFMRLPYMEKDHG